MIPCVHNITQRKTKFKPEFLKCVIFVNYANNYVNKFMLTPETKSNDLEGVFMRSADNGGSAFRNPYILFVQFSLLFLAVGKFYLPYCANCT